ncbi:metallothionein-like protein type 2 MET1 [Rosa rugosa]|uniref:metallothionein-like protein type 2 MET1 n=1 Tax=Rosa rugosa TaxID=74645 RepID=UPI002B406AE2|nr:metallothionein-like protein type 2 MET1 [Rosa rugosa]
MSCCGGKCGCGAGCKCGSGCGGCANYADITEQSSASETLVMGVVGTQKVNYGEAEAGVATEGGCNGCKCVNCTCDPCTCK